VAKIVKVLKEFCLRVLLHLCKFHPAIKLLTKGEIFQMAAGEILPPQISGWLGWMGRAWLGRNIALAWPALFAVVRKSSKRLFCQRIEKRPTDFIFKSVGRFSIRWTIFYL